MSIFLHSHGLKEFKPLRLVKYCIKGFVSQMINMFGIGQCTLSYTLSNRFPLHKYTKTHILHTI